MSTEKVDPATDEEVAEIMFVNDDWQETPEQRWQRMREWVAEQIAT